MTDSEVEIGTVSHGTLRPEDLIPAFMFELERLDGAAAAALTERYAGEGWPRSMDGLSFGEYITDHPEESGWLLESLFDALGEIAPPGCYFGSLEGDGSDFGFWNSDLTCEASRCLNRKPVAGRD